MTHVERTSQPPVRGSKIADAALHPGTYLVPGAGEPWTLIERLHDRGDLIRNEETHAWFATSLELCKIMGRRDDALWQSALIPTDARELPGGLDL